MDLREQFTKETGCGTSNYSGDGYYPPYTEWLEKKLEATNDRTAKIKKLIEKIKIKSTRCEHKGKCKHDPCTYRLAVEIDKILSRAL